MTRLAAARWALLGLVLIAPGTAVADPAEPRVQVAATADVALDLGRLPDLLQTDARLGLPDGGRMFCAPVSAGAALLFLAQQGFGRLAPEAPEAALAAADVVRRLGSSHYMNTSLAEGTGTSGFLRGLARYVTDRGYTIRRLDYAGWRAHPKGYASGRSRPDLPALADALRRPATAAWWNVGWYRREIAADGQTPQWRRTGGHWVLVAGHDAGAEGGAWLARDPSPRSGRRPRVERLALETLVDGELVGDYPGLPQVARGMPRVLSGLALPQDADTALVDGVVVLELEPQAASR
ncbi:MAG: hypothetical protein AB7T63_04555 [Planctomycetota bacterium]